MRKYKPSTMLRRGADLLEREERKWCQRAYVGYCGAVCAMGAVFFANATKEEIGKVAALYDSGPDVHLDIDYEADLVDDEADTLVYGMLRNELGEDVLRDGWADEVVRLNDERAGSREEAIAIMREKADELEARGQ